MDVSCKLNLRRTLFSKIPIDIIYWRLCMICLYLYLILFHANIIQKHHFLFPWYQSQIPCSSCSSTFYSNDRQNFPKANTKKHNKKPIVSFPFFSVLNSKMSMITADRAACHDIAIVTVAKDYACIGTFRITNT